MRRRGEGALVDQSTKMMLSPEEELAYSKSRVIELGAQSRATRLATALDERLREFHARKIAELTARLAAQSWSVAS